MVSEEQVQQARDTPALQGGIIPPSADSGLTLVDLIQRVRKHIVTLIATVVVVLAAIAAYLVVATPQYTATAQLYVTANTRSATAQDDINSINTAGSYIANQIKSYPKLATTQTVLQPVVDKLQLHTSLGQLSKAVEVTNPTGTVFVDISVTDVSAEQSANIANAVAESLSDVVSTQLGQNSNEVPITLSLVERAVTPGSPSKPNKQLIMLVGLVLAVILGVLAALLKDMVATRIQEPSDLTDLIDLPVLGRVPDNKLLHESRPIVVSNPNSPLAEEFRRIRTNVSFTTMVEGTASRLLVVSSTVPNEGKTTIAANLAAALAENGAAVLIIDADLRLPFLAETLGLEGNVGLAHVLSGQAAVKDVVQRYWKPNLHVMPAGPKVGNASVLLNSKMMKSMLMQALKQYSYVIVDTAPLTVANDAEVFGSMAGGVLLVSGRNMTMKRDLKDVIGNLQTIGVPVLGFVFNYLKERKHRHGDYYYYYYENQDGERHATRKSAGNQRSKPARKK